jgi:group I intron endonuclease
MIAVYQIKNIINGKMYVGSSIDVHQRWNSHKNRLKRGTHSNYLLQEEYNSYGEHAFEYSILEEVYDKSIILEREQYWMDNTKCCNVGYNIFRYAGSAKGQIHSNDTKSKIGKANTGEGNGFFGKTHSNEYKQSIKKRQTGSSNIKAKLSEELVAHIKYLAINEIMKPKDITRKYGVNKVRISSIKNNRTWSHIEPKLMEELL